MCELRIEGGVDESGVDDELYGIQLDNDGASDFGHFICKMGGTFVGRYPPTEGYGLQCSEMKEKYFQIT